LSLLLSLLLLASCRGERRSLRVGSKNFSESVLLGEIVAQALEARGVKVDRRLNLGGTFVCHRAMVAGELDLYPEYTGTAFTAILQQKPINDAAEVRQRVAREYEKRWHLQWSAPLGFENTFALVVRGDLARMVVECGWDLNELRPAAMSLEEIFLELTGSQDAAPKKEAAPEKEEVNQ